MFNFPKPKDQKIISSYRRRPILGGEYDTPTCMNIEQQHCFFVMLSHVHRDRCKHSLPGVSGDPISERKGGRGDV